MSVSSSRRRSFGVLVAVSLASAALVGCDGEEEPVPEQSTSVSPEASENGLRGGTFNATLPSGATVRIILPATPPPDKDVDALRQDAGIERALYAKISIDNSKGDRPVSVSRLVLTAEDGALYRLDALPRVVPEWASSEGEDGDWTNAGGDAVSRKTARDIDRRVAETVEKYTGDVPAGGRGEEILVGDLSRIPATFTSMELIPSIGDSEERAVRPSPDSGNAPAAPRPATPADPVPPDAPGTPGGETPPGQDPGDQDPPNDDRPAPTSEPDPEAPGGPAEGPEEPEQPVPPDTGGAPTSAPEAVAPSLPTGPTPPAQAAGDPVNVRP